MNDEQPTTGEIEQANVTPEPESSGEVQTPEPFAVFPTAEAFHDRMERATRARLREIASEAGFGSWDELQSQLAQQLAATATANTAPDEPTDEQAPETTTEGPSEAELLRLAVKVAADKGLPATLALRIQGATEADMSADADQLIAAMGTAGGPGIPPVRQAAAPVTFTAEQLSNPQFVRDHADEIRRAAAEGRVVRS